MKRAWLFMPLFILLLWSNSLWASPETIEQAHLLLDNWQRNEAGKVVAQLQQEGDESPEAMYLMGRYAFEMSDYETALEYLNGAAGYRPDDKRRQDYAPLLQAVYDNVQGFASKQSAHFEVRYRPDKDALLADAALDTLEKSYAALKKDLGYAPPDRIVLEIYPELGMLARATGLTLENLMTSGVIAICKFNRLMITSPRVSPLGYPWRDTVNHEYVHLVISRIGGNNVPIWLHEGLAKFHEERWRRKTGGELEASAEALLARALKENKLVTLEDISPSMAYLPSQEHTALAFAEVLTIIQWLHNLRGGAGLQQLLQTLGQGENLNAAFMKVYGFGMDTLQRKWRHAMQIRNLRERDGIVNDYSILFGDSTTDEEKEIRQIKKTKGRNLMTLGKLLKDRQHSKAAGIEFEKAQGVLGNENILLQNYLAQSDIDNERYQDAVRELKPILPLSPNWLPTHIRLGHAYAAMGDYERAVTQLQYAFGINPFDPRIYGLLRTCYAQLGQPHLAEQAKSTYEELLSQRR